MLGLTERPEEAIAIADHEESGDPTEGGLRYESRDSERGHNKKSTNAQDRGSQSVLIGEGGDEADTDRAESTEETVRDHVQTNYSNKSELRSGERCFQEHGDLANRL